MLSRTTFEYLDPPQIQKDQMELCRAAARAYSDVIEIHVPDGPDKTYIMRKLREVAMWVNVAITRDTNGTPRVSER